MSGHAEPGLGPAAHDRLPPDLPGPDQIESLVDRLPSDDVRTGDEGRMRSLWRFVRSDWALTTGLFVLAVILLMIVVGPLVYRTDPLASSPQVIQSPSWQHPLGTDSLGRDLLARVLVGMRTSLLISLVATLLVSFWGIVFGLLVGYRGGAVDWIGMRIVDITLAIPTLLFAVAVLAALGANPWTLLGVLVVAFIPQTVRVLRASAMQVRHRDFVYSAVISGVGSTSIMRRHVFPNVRATAIVQASIMAAHILLAESSLSFLGLGVQPPTPSLGAMVNEGRQWMEIAPWVVLVPGTVVVAAIASFTLIGQGLDRALVRRE